MSKGALSQADLVAMVREGQAAHRGGDYQKAVSLYEAALRHLPGNADVIHFLGMAKYKLDAIEEARTLFRKSLEINPGRAIVHVNLGRTYLNESDYSTALRCFENALKADPAHWEAQHMAGRALIALGSPHDAIQMLELARRAQSSNTEILHDLAKAYGDSRRHGAAIPVYEDILRAAPDDVRGLIGLGFSRRMQNDSDGAAEAYERAIALADSGDHALQCELGNTLEDLGDFEGAESLYRAVLDKKPGYPLAIAPLLAVKKGKEEPALAEWGEKHLSGGDLTRPARVVLGFAMGKHYDAVKDYDNAFRSFTAANNLVAEISPYDARSAAEGFVRRAQNHDNNLFERLQTVGSQGKRPIFIVGMPRSGTTLTEQILSSHPAVVGAGELGFFMHVAHDMAGSDEALPDRATYEKMLTAPFLKSVAEEYLSILDRFSKDAAHIVDKMPMNFLNMGLIALVFPNAKFIHCRRNPIDNCLSCFVENFHEDQRYATKLESLGDFYCRYSELMTHWRNVLPNAVLDVQYEETVADFETQVRRIVDFCGLDWDDNCLRFYETERSVNTPSRWQVRQPIYGSSVERWRRYERHLDPLLKALAPVL